MRSLIVALALLAAGCVTGPRAHLQALHNRAVVDLGCPAQHVYLYHLDGRTKTAMGCGRRLVYVEDCFVDGSQRQCTWLLDTPSFDQQAWPQSHAAQQAVGQQAVGQHAAPRARVYRTDLHGDASEPIDPNAQPPRRVRTQLFGEESAPMSDDVLLRRR